MVVPFRTCQGISDCHFCWGRSCSTQGSEECPYRPYLYIVPYSDVYLTPASLLPPASLNKHFHHLMQPPSWVSGANLACRCVHSTLCTTHNFREAAHQLCNIVCVIMCDSLVHILMAVPRSCLMLLRQNLKHKSAVPCCVCPTSPAAPPPPQ